MSLLDGTRPLKRWRWVGIFSEELMACAALVQVGLARQSFWALHLRDSDGPLRERTRMFPRRSEVQLTMGRPASSGAPARLGRVVIHDRGVALDVSLQEEAGFQSSAPTGPAGSGRASRPGSRPRARSRWTAAPRGRYGRSP